MQMLNQNKEDKKKLMECEQIRIYMNKVTVKIILDAGGEGVDQTGYANRNNTGSRR